MRRGGRQLRRRAVVLLKAPAARSSHQFVTVYLNHQPLARCYQLPVVKDYCYCLLVNSASSLPRHRIINFTVPHGA